MKVRFLSMMALLSLVLFFPVGIQLINFYTYLYALVTEFGSAGWDTSLLSGGVSAVLVVQAFGVLLCLPSLVISSITIIKCRYRANWFAYCLRILAVGMVLTPPLFSLVGVFVYALSHRAKVIHN